MKLSLADGRQLAIHGTAVLGREPDRPGCTAVPLADAGFTASRNHAMLTPVDERLVEVIDLGSTNGTSVQVGERPVELRPHEPTLVTLPVTLMCGDCRVDVLAG